VRNADLITHQLSIYEFLKKIPHSFELLEFGVTQSHVMLSYSGIYWRKSPCNIDFAFTWTQNLHELKTGRFHQNQHPNEVANFGLSDETP
jgi:hypothetical protein